MSSLTNNAPFSLNAINLRKELVFPDGSIQTTAYTGTGGIPTLAQVLDTGNNANGIGIVELPFIHINDVDNSSVITQSGTILAIQSGGDPSFGGTANSILSLQVTDAGSADYEAINITDARVLVYPELQLGTSIQFPDTSVQTSAPRYFDYIENQTPASLLNGYGNPNTTLNVITLPTLTVEGQYFVQFTLSLEIASGTVDNLICRETFVALSPGQIATDYSIPYQYPNVDAIFGFIGAGSIFVSGSIILNTLTPNLSGVVLNLAGGWTNSGTITFQNGTAIISYIGASTGAV